MRHVTIVGALAIGLAALSTSVTLLPVTAQQPTVQPKVLLKHNLIFPGYQTVMAAVEIPFGGRERRHTHSGAIVV